MKIKKLIASCTMMCALIVALVVGVLAASTATVDVIGSVTYTAKGNVHAKLEMSHTSNSVITATATATTGGPTCTNGGGEDNAVGTIVFSGSETNGNGAFTLGDDGTIQLKQPSYSYTLTITNTYTELDAQTKDKTSLKLIFVEPESNSNVSVSYTQGYNLTEGSSGDKVQKTLILAENSSISITVKFSADAIVATQANLGISLQLEATNEVGQSVSVNP